LPTRFIEKNSTLAMWATKGITIVAGLAFSQKTRKRVGSKLQYRKFANLYRNKFEASRITITKLHNFDI